MFSPTQKLAPLLWSVPTMVVKPTSPSISTACLLGDDGVPPNCRLARSPDGSKRRNRRLHVPSSPPPSEPSAPSVSGVPPLLSPPPPHPAGGGPTPGPHLVLPSDGPPLQSTDPASFAEMVVGVVVLSIVDGFLSVVLSAHPQKKHPFVSLPEVVLPESHSVSVGQSYVGQLSGLDGFVLFLPLRSTLAHGAPLSAVQSQRVA